MRAYRIAYDGREYHGFQRQPTVPTVEGDIFDALTELEVLAEDAPKPPGYAAAGRTDAGVSALAQTIAFEAPDWLTPRAFNSALPPSIRAWAAAEVPADFHATFDATDRSYVYFCYAPPTREEADTSTAGTGPVTGPFDHEDPIDDDRFDDALEALSGHHDFHNLTPDDHGTERSPTLEATRTGRFLRITVTASGFARELVRRLVSLAVAVGTGTEPFEKIDRALGPDPLPGHDGIEPAPPEPLVLSDVTYQHCQFERDEEAARRSRSILDRRRIDQVVGARVAAHLVTGLESR